MSRPILKSSALLLVLIGAATAAAPHLSGGPPRPKRRAPRAPSHPERASAHPWHPVLLRGLWRVRQREDSSPPAASRRFRLDRGDEAHGGGGLHEATGHCVLTAEARPHGGDLSEDVLRTVRRRRSGALASTQGRTRGRTRLLPGRRRRASARHSPPRSSSTSSSRSPRRTARTVVPVGVQGHRRPEREGVRRFSQSRRLSRR